MADPTTPYHGGGPPNYADTPPSYFPDDESPSPARSRGGANVSATMRLLPSNNATTGAASNEMRPSSPSPTRTSHSRYYPVSTSSRPSSSSGLGQTPNIPPPSDSYHIRTSSIRSGRSGFRDGSPTRPWTPSSGSPTRPPPASSVYEAIDLNGSPRPGTPSTRYGGSPRRPLPPAPLFSATGGVPQPRRSQDETIPIEGDDVFSDANRTNDPRASLKSYDSYMSDETATGEYYPNGTNSDGEDETDSTSRKDLDDVHYGPAPKGRQDRRGVRQAQMTKKEVSLINGELILECKIPTILHSFLPRRDEREFTHLRYTAVTCDPDDFVARGYKLRQNIGSTARDTELFICVTMYNENEIDFTRTMHGVMRNISHFCSRTKSRTWGKDGWQKIVVCIISDGRRKVHPRTLNALAAMGVYQDGIAKNVVNQKEVTAHVYEYTTQVSLDADLKFKGAEKGIVPCQMIFCLKEKNQKKLNSHRWFFNAFGRALMPNVCILLDVGTKPEPKALYHLWYIYLNNL